jgi:hypothetical protein
VDLFRLDRLVTEYALDTSGVEIVVYQPSWQMRQPHAEQRGVAQRLTMADRVFRLDPDLYHPFGRRNGPGARTSLAGEDEAIVMNELVDMSWPSPRFQIVGSLPRWTAA